MPMGERRADPGGHPVARGPGGVRVVGGAGCYPSMHWAKAGRHPELVTNPSQGPHTIHSHTHTPRTICPLQLRKPACVWTVEEAHTEMGEHAHSIQKGPGWNSDRVSSYCVRTATDSLHHYAAPNESSTQKNNKETALNMPIIMNLKLIKIQHLSMIGKGCSQGILITPV